MFTRSVWVDKNRPYLAVISSGDGEQSNRDEMSVPRSEYSVMVIDVVRVLNPDSSHHSHAKDYTALRVSLLMRRLRISQDQ